MAEISAAAVKSLRERTDLPMMKCKEALIEAGGDEEKAVEILKKQAKGLIDKRSANATSEGRFFVAAKPDGSEAVMVEVQCESAPVAGSEALANLGNALAQQLLNGPGAMTAEELLAQPAPGGKGTLNDLYEDVVNRIREKIVVGRVIRAKGPLGTYVHHDGKVGVLFQAEGKDSQSPVLRDVAMHIAAIRPKVANAEDLDPALVAQERQRLTEEAQKSGKPANIVEKMVDGRIKQWYAAEAGVLVYQPFAKDDSKTVSQALAEQGMKAKAFVLWILGRGNQA